jgi:hypothetical protein
VTAEFANLPPLTPREAELVGAMLTPHASIHDVADQLDIPFAQLFDILASPAVKTHLDHIRKSLDTRLRIRLADAAHAAVDTLDEIVRSPTPHGNPNLKPTAADATIEWQTERRRAATTILRAHAAPRTRPHARRPRSRHEDITRTTRLLDRLQGLTDNLEATPPASRDEPVSSATPPDSRHAPATNDSPRRADAHHTTNHATPESAKSRATGNPHGQHSRAGPHPIRPP